MDSFPKQLSHWEAASVAMMNPWDLERQSNPYNNHLWTLSAELRSSFILYLTPLSLSTVRPAGRVAAVSLGALVFAVHNKWEITSVSSWRFASCQVKAAIRAHGEQRRLSHFNGDVILRRCLHALSLVLLLAGLHRCSFGRPQGDETGQFCAP